MRTREELEFDAECYRRMNMQKQKYIDELTEELEDRSYPMIGLFLIFIAWVPVIAIGFLIWLVLNG